MFAILSDEAWVLGVLSSHVQTLWALAVGGDLGPTPRYNNSVCFDPSPFPDCHAALKCEVGRIAEQIDSMRRERQTLYPEISLTDMYNVLNKLRCGGSLSSAERSVHDQALVSVLRQLNVNLISPCSMRTGGTIWRTRTRAWART